MESLSSLSQDRIILLIQEGEMSHEKRMRELHQEEETLKALIDSEKAALARELRELNLQQANSQAKKHMSSLSDMSMKVVLECLKSPLKNFRTVLNKMEDAVQNILRECRPVSTSSGFVSSEEAKKGVLSSFSAVVICHSTVKGIRPWADSHLRLCNRCTTKFSQSVEKTLHLVSARKGFSLKPSIESIPDKKAYRLSACLRQQPSLKYLKGTEELQFPLLKCEIDLQLLIAPDAVAKTKHHKKDWIKQLEKWCNDSLSGSLKIAKVGSQKVFQGPSSDASSFISSTMEIFLHTLTVKASVTLRRKEKNNNGVVKHTDTHMASSSHNLSETTEVTVCIVFSTPLHIAAFTPFMELLRDQSMRATLLTEIVEPVLKDFAQHFTLLENFSPFISEGVKHAIVLWDSIDELTECSAPVSRFTFLRKLYNILCVLGVAETSIEVDIAFPVAALEANDKEEVKESGPTKNDICVQGEQIATNCAMAHSEDDDRTSLRTSVAQMFKKSVRYLRSILSCFSPPSEVFPSPDRKKMELAIAVRKIPRQLTTVLSREIAAVFGAGSEASLGSSVLNFFVSPESQVNFGLRMLSELCINVYRPFHPCTGISVSSSCSPNNASCAPITVLTPSSTQANIQIAKAYFTLSKALEKVEACIPAASTFLEKCFHDNGEDARKKVTEWVTLNEDLNKIKEEYTALSLKSVHWESVTCTTLLPLHQFERNAPESCQSEPLLFACFNLKRLN